MNPFDKFSEWYEKELKASSVSIPSACCFSTIGLDAYPNSRFVSLKEIKNEAFIITGPLNSRKGHEIAENTAVALTFWWPHTEKQVRIQGDAYLISDEEADLYFKNRNKDSQIVSTISDQGASIDTLADLKEQFQMEKIQLKDLSIPRPKNWGGFAIRPKRIEFMTFDKSRFHKRRLFEKTDDNWVITLLQP